MTDLNRCKSVFRKGACRTVLRLCDVLSFFVDNSDFSAQSYLCKAVAVKRLSLFVLRSNHKFTLFVYVTKLFVFLRYGKSAAAKAHNRIKLRLYDSPSVFVYITPFSVGFRRGKPLLKRIRIIKGKGYHNSAAFVGIAVFAVRLDLHKTMLEKVAAFLTHKVDIKNLKNLKNYHCHNNKAASDSNRNLY